MRARSDVRKLDFSPGFDHNGRMNFDPKGFDPTKLDPKTLMEMSQLIQQLPPHQINRMQTLMHNMMAGFDVRKEMEEFERSLPPGFREKLVAIMGPAAATFASQAGAEVSRESSTEMPKDVHEARITILRAVAERQVTPEEAIQLLFPKP